MKRRNKDNELVDENGLRIGDHIQGSKYFRSFCVECDEPIRVTTENLIDPICDRCSRQLPKLYRPASGEPFVRGLNHLKDYEREGFDK